MDKLPMKDFLLAAKIEVKQKETELLKIVQCLNRRGVDTTQIMRVYNREGSDEKEKAVADESIRTVWATDAAQATSSAINNEAGQCALPNSPRLEDYPISEYTLRMIRMMDLGLELPKSPPLRSALPSSSARDPKQEQESSTNQNRPALFDSIRPLDETQNTNRSWRQIDKDVYTCTPDIFSKKAPKRTAERKDAKPLGMDPTRPTLRKECFDSVSPVSPVILGVYSFEKDPLEEDSPVSPKLLTTSTERAEIRNMFLKKS